MDEITCQRTMPIADSEHEALIDRLLDQSLSLPEGERAEFIARAAAGDTALVERLTRLLAQAARSDGFLERAVLQSPERLASDSEPAHQGMAIGAYRLARKLGVGGMGEVWLAERIAGGFQQQVAIKLMRAESTSAARFDAEREILASLEHPAIARLYDGGVSEQGRPYMVMEYVEGEDLLSWCRRRACDLRQRLALFLAVCDAVAYAHAQLVVHRDLKPANIMVNEAGHVKLLDFGIAKLLTPGAIDDATRTAHLSPAYAAPEQLTGGRIGTAADVHALGATLCELLTERLPWNVQGLPLGLVVERLLYQTPPPPSAIAAEAGPVSARALRGDLDAIIAKALRSEPAARYPDARALGEEVRRFIAYEPVSARSGARWYVARRFLRRHWLPVGTVTILLLSMAIAIAGIAWQARIAASERDAARIESERTNALLNFLTTMFRETAQESGQGSAISARAVLERSAQRLGEAFADDPQQRRATQQALAEIYYALRDYAAARPLFQSLLVDVGPEVSPLVIATNQTWLANIELWLGNYEEGRRLITDSMRFWNSDPTRFIEERLRARHIESMLATAIGDVERAISSLRETVNESTALLGATHEQTMNYISSLGVALETAGHLDEAEVVMQRALEIARDRQDLGERSGLAIQNNLASIKHSLGRLDEAEALYREVITGLLATYGRSMNVAQVQNNLAKLLEEDGRGIEALEVIDLAEPVAREFGGDDNSLVLRLKLRRVSALLIANRLKEATALRAEIAPKIASIPERSDSAAGLMVLDFRLALATGKIADPKAARRSLDAELSKFGSIAADARRRLAQLKFDPAAVSERQ